MNTSAILTGSLAATLLLTCAACTKIETQSAVPKRDYFKEGILVKKGNKTFLNPSIVDHGLSIAPKEEEFIKPCSMLPTHPNATRLVTLRIDDKFDVKNTPRHVDSKAANGSGAKPVKEPGPHLNPTTYDLKLDKDVWDSTGQIIGVKIILKDEELKFLDDDHSVTTIKSDSPETSMFICLDARDLDTVDDADPTPGKDKYASVTFYVDETNRRVQKFNIRLVVIQKNYPYVLPIIIDPEIENTGFQ